MMFRLPFPQIPQLELLPYIVVDSLSMAIVIVAFHISVSKILSNKHGYTIEPAQVSILFTVNILLDLHSLIDLHASLLE